MVNLVQIYFQIQLIRCANSSIDTCCETDAFHLTPRDSDIVQVNLLALIPALMSGPRLNGLCFLCNLRLAKSSEADL